MKPALALLILIVCSTSCFGGDRMQRIHFGGKPMFMIGVYRHPAGPADEAVLEDLAGAGFNTLLVPPTTAEPVFDKMDRLGIRAMVTLGGTMVLSGDDAARAAAADKLKQAVGSLKDLPALLGWEGPDEALWSWKRPYGAHASDTPVRELSEEAQRAISDQIDALKNGYALVKSVDLERFVFVNFAPRSEIDELRWFTAGDRGRPAADAFGVDIYPVPGGRGNNGPVKGKLTPDISAVGSFTAKQREIAGDAPIYMVLQGCGILDWTSEAAEKALRRPTFEEERFMAFEAVAKGANGILWWGTHYISHDSELWRDIKRTARQVSSLEPVLALGQIAPVKCSSPEIELIRYTWKGHNYVVAVNASGSDMAAVALGWRGLGTGRVNVLFEERAVAAVGDTFHDNFRPYDVHVYSDDFSSSATTTHKVRCAFGLPLNAPQFEGKSHAEVARTLGEMGIDAVCAIHDDRDLIRELHLAGLKVYAEIGAFGGTGYWQAHPESRPINADGNPISEPGSNYGGVCPNQEWLRAELIEKVNKKFSTYEYDGLWLDFIRYPGRWEQERPIIEETCFCEACLDAFARRAGISCPADLETAAQKADWILRNHRPEWVEFKCDTITSMVAEIKTAMKKLNPDAILGIFNVPWTREDFNGAVVNILGQDIRALAEHVDVFSPMVYHEMCHFPMSWIADYANYAWENTDREIWPIVQVCDQPVAMSPEEVFQTVRTGLSTYGSTGVMVFTLGYGLADEAKAAAMIQALR